VHVIGMLVQQKPEVGGRPVSRPYGQQHRGQLARARQAIAYTRVNPANNSVSEK
jgi:hypothetical protein